MRKCLLGCLLAAIGLSPGVAAAKKLDVEAALARRIIDASLPLNEVMDFTEARVLPMPAVTSVAEWERHARRMRKQTFKRVVYRGEAAKWRTLKTRVVWLETIEGGPGYKIRKLRYEAVPGLWIPALLYLPDHLTGKVPVVMNVNGHDGNGKVAAYKQIRCINQAKRGMIALNVEWLGMGQLRTANFLHYRMNQLNLCGTSGLAPFYLSMKRGLDVLLSLEHADPNRVGVAGLSGGGWQTIFISSLDERVTFSDPVAGYSSFKTRVRNHSDLGDSEQTPCDLGTVTDYAQLTAMRAPRPTLLTFNAADNCCFRADHALQPLLDAAQPIYKLYGKPRNLRWHINTDPGTHNFLKDNRQALYRALGDYFYPGDKSFRRDEIPSDQEVKTKEQLFVPLPKSNADFHSLAMRLSQHLPRDADIPTETDAKKSWRAAKRNLLAKIVRAERYKADGDVVKRIDGDDGTAVFWKLRLDDTWTLPAVVLTRGTPKATVIVVADAGKKSVAAEAEQLLKAGNRVVAVDPFYFGESKITSRDALFGLLVSAVGSRPLGLQASQIAAVARAAEDYYADGPVRIVAVGPRSSLYALVAAGLEPNAIAGVELHGSFGSLREIITKNMAVNEAPDLFCFGLLERFDIPQLTALVAPRTVKFVGKK